MTRSRRPPAPARVSRDRWLVAYADMLTLLFAVFVSMYAARIDFLPPASVAASNGGPISGSLLPTPGQPGVEDPMWSRIQQVIAKSDRLKAVEMRREGRSVVITLPEEGAFPAGRAELTPAAQRVVTDLAEVIRSSASPVRVEGHTDDVPIHTAAFASNWELSTARATEVVQFLVQHGGVPASRLSAAGFGEFRPLIPNASDAARAKNRRVELIILNASASSPAVTIR